MDNVFSNDSNTSPDYSGLVFEDTLEWWKNLLYFFQNVGNSFFSFMSQPGVFTGFTLMTKTMFTIWVCKLHLYYKFKILSIFYVVKNKILNNKLLLCFFYILVRFLTLGSFFLLIVSG
jgi:hypothetical protein